MPGSFIALSPRPLFRPFRTTPAAGPVRLMFWFPGVLNARDATARREAGRRRKK